MSEAPLIVKGPSRRSKIDLDDVSAVPCNFHNSDLCEDTHCLAIAGYKRFLSGPDSTIKSQQLNLVRLSVVTGSGRNEITNCQCLICVEFSATEFSIRVHLIGLDQPGISHCFAYDNEQFNQLKQRHGLNVNMSEFVGYVDGILQNTQPTANNPDSVWYSLKLEYDLMAVRLIITENRLRRYLLFLSLESQDVQRLPEILAEESLNRWQFATALVQLIKNEREQIAVAAREEQARLDSQKRVLGDKTQQIALLRSELEQLNESVNTLQNLRVEESASVKKMEEQVHTLKAERSKLLERLKEEESRSAELAGENERLQEEVDRARRDIEFARLQFLENEERFANSKELAAQLAHASSELDLLRDLNEKLVSEHGSVTSKVTATTTELVELRRECLAVTEAHQLLLAERADWTAQRKRLEEAYNVARIKASSCEAAENECDELKKTCEHLRSEMRKLNLHVAKRLLQQPRWAARPATLASSDEELEDADETAIENLPRQPCSNYDTYEATTRAYGKRWMRAREDEASTPSARAKHVPHSSLFTR